jgi:hypothetical protein
VHGRVASDVSQFLLPLLRLPLPQVIGDTTCEPVPAASIVLHVRELTWLVDPNAQDRIRDAVLRAYTEMEEEVNEPSAS